MIINTFLSFFECFFCIGLAAFLIWRDRRSFIHRVFALGMVALAVEALFNGFASQAVSITEMIRWQRLELVAVAFIPGIWLVFSLIFARKNYREIIKKWRWTILGAFVVPWVLIFVSFEHFFINETGSSISPGWVIRLDWAGYLFYLFFLIIAVLILVNLERTLRSSTGSARWQIKFMVLGIGSLFACRYIQQARHCSFLPSVQTWRCSMQRQLF